MEENTNFVEELIEKTVDYGKSSLELAKLKALDKTLDVVSTFLSYSIVVVLVISFMLFISLGLALWAGKILGEIYYGFFVVAGFYCVLAILIYFFLHKWIKNQIGNAFIKQVLK